MEVALLVSVNTVDTVDTADSVYTIQTALHCLNSSMSAYIYCKGRSKRYWNGKLSKKSEWSG